MPHNNDPRSMNEKELIQESEKLETQLKSGDMTPRELSRLKGVRRALAALEEAKLDA